MAALAILLIVAFGLSLLLFVVALCTDEDLAVVWTFTMTGVTAALGLALAITYLAT